MEEKKAGCVLVAKDNQSLIENDILDLEDGIFPPPRTETTKGHGRIETRTIRASCALNNCLEFPYLGHVFRIERNVTPTHPT